MTALDPLRIPTNLTEALALRVHQAQMRSLVGAFHNGSSYRRGRVVLANLRTPAPIPFAPAHPRAGDAKRGGWVLLLRPVRHAHFIKYLGYVFHRLLTVVSSLMTTVERGFSRCVRDCPAAREKQERRRTP